MATLHNVRGRQTNTHTGRQNIIFCLPVKQSDTDRQTNGQTDRQADRQTDRQTNLV